MKVIILSASPNLDGLTAACARAALAGAAHAGAMVEEVRLTDLDVGMCEQCGNGWGTCLPDHRCQVEDDFQALHARLLQADALVLISPVYYGEMSESAKACTDRFRRCEATRGADSGLAGKPVIVIAAAGGSGNGAITCLQSLERWLDHLKARKFDLIPVNRWSREYKLAAIQAAAEGMMQEVKNK